MVAEFATQLVSRLLHQFVAVAAAFEDAGLQAAGAVADFAVGDLLEHLQHIGFQFLGSDQATRQLHPRGQHILAGTGETDLPGLPIVQKGRGRRRRSNQIVTHDGRPQFPPNHLRRLATHVAEVQVRFDAA